MQAGLTATIPHLVLPWVGPSLSEVLKGRAKWEIVGLERIVVVQVSDALKYLHSVHVIHTDIKPGNVLIRECDRRAVIIDFNTSEIADPMGEWQPRSTVYSTYPWRAPELWRVAGFNGVRRALTFAVDIWSFGVTCVETISGGGRFFGTYNETNTGVRIKEWAASTRSLDAMVNRMPTQWRCTIRGAMQPQPTSRQFDVSFDALTTAADTRAPHKAGLAAAESSSEARQA